MKMTIPLLDQEAAEGHWPSGVAEPGPTATTPAEAVALGIPSSTEQVFTHDSGGWTQGVVETVPAVLFFPHSPSPLPPSRRGF